MVCGRKVKGERLNTSLRAERKYSHPANGLSRTIWKLDLTYTQSPQPRAKISIVVATYNRSLVLSRALRTVIAQSEEGWQALVIGDCCSDDTEAQIAALGDDRIHFVNLPERFGEQAGPNSVGMALAQSPYVAFLNHDDYWLPDHLALAMSELESSGADLYWSRAAFFSNRGAWDERVFFDDVSPCGRRLEDMYDGAFFLAEPMSAWVARRRSLDRLGPMKLSSETAQMPVVEYCQRACRAGMQLKAGDHITVLKDRVWHEPPGYRNKAEYAEPWVRQIESGQTDDLRQVVEEDLWLSDAIGMNRAIRHETWSYGQAATARIHSETGANLAEIREAARMRSPLLLNTVGQYRTGASVQRQPRVEDMVSYARGAIR